jgi:hypothetical protein
MFNCVAWFVTLALAGALAKAIEAAARPRTAKDLSDIFILHPRT